MSKHSKLDVVQSTPASPHDLAALELAARAPALKVLIDKVGMPALREPIGDHFAELVRSILYQQLAGSAAAAIHGRLIAAVDGVMTPASVLALQIEDLRAVGLSANKAASLLDLASKVEEGILRLDSEALAEESDEEIITELCTVRGIGPWTAHMFLMFQLRRLDVWPVGDLGVRRGYGLAWGVEMPTPKQLMSFGEPLRPYRSVAAWYCWRACEVYGRAERSVLTG